MTQFSVGNVVSLKSGGPSMTVISLPAEGQVCTTWFSDKPNSLLSEDEPRGPILVHYWPPDALTLVAK